MMGGGPLRNMCFTHALNLGGGPVGEVKPFLQPQGYGPGDEIGTMAATGKNW